MFAWAQAADAADHARRPSTPTSSATAPDAKERVLAAYPDYPRRRALIAIGSDAMFGAPAWAFADAYSAHAPTYVYRFDHTTLDACGCWGSAPPTAARSCTSSTATRRISGASCIRWAVGCSRRSAGACSGRG